MAEVINVALTRMRTNYIYNKSQDIRYIKKLNRYTGYHRFVF